MNEEEDTTLDAFNPPKLHKENVDYSYLLTQILHTILISSNADLTNDIASINKLTNLVDYLALFVMPLRDSRYFADLEEIKKITNQEIKTKAIWLAIINLLSRRKLLFKRQRSQMI